MGHAHKPGCSLFHSLATWMNVRILRYSANLSELIYVIFVCLCACMLEYPEYGKSYHSPAHAVTIPHEFCECLSIPIVSGFFQTFAGGGGVVSTCMRKLMFTKFWIVTVTYHPLIKASSVLGTRCSRWGALQSRRRLPHSSQVEEAELRTYGHGHVATKLACLRRIWT